MYKTVQITCFTKVFYVTAFGFVGCILFYSFLRPILRTSSNSVDQWDGLFIQNDGYVWILAMYHGDIKISPNDD